MASGCDLPDVCEAGDECSAGADVLGKSAAPAAVAGAGALPYTGIGDVLLPILLGAIGLMGGVVLYRWAFVRDRLLRISRGMHQHRDTSPSRPTGFTDAARVLSYEDREFWARSRKSA